MFRNVKYILPLLKYVNNICFTFRFFNLLVQVFKFNFML